MSARSKLMPALWLALAAILITGHDGSGAAEARPRVLSVVSFNVESDRDTDPQLVGRVIARISRTHGVDLFGLAEVGSQADAQVFAMAASRDGGSFEPILAGNGDRDRVAILYNADTLKLSRTFELDRFPGSRKAMVAQLSDRASGQDFLFIANHFNRRDTDRRNRQAQLVRDWVLAQDLPAILVGDFNFDFDPLTGRGNAAFGIFTADPALRWVRPECIASGTCPKTGTQCDRRFNSIMDFVLVADHGRNWPAVSEVLFREQADYCDRERNGGSDHRPVLGLITLQ